MKQLFPCVIAINLALSLHGLEVSPPAQPNSCDATETAIVQFEAKKFPVQKIKNAVLFRAGMDVDADGAPNAYGPYNTGLDFTANAKNGTKFVGVVVGPDGTPIVQVSGPFKGFYVSTTSLRAAGTSLSDPTTYVDATKIPYIALPPEFVKQFNVVLGDLAVVTNHENAKSAFAIYADVGPYGKIGEGSVALANALGLESNPRHGGTKNASLSYLVFPKSGLGQGKLRTSEEINASAGKLFADWGGANRLKACSSNNMASHTQVCKPNCGILSNKAFPRGPKPFLDARLCRSFSLSYDFKHHGHGRGRRVRVPRRPRHAFREGAARHVQNVAVNKGWGCN